MLQILAKLLLKRSVITGNQNGINKKYGTLHLQSSKFMLKPPPPAMPALAAGTQVTSKMLSAYTASWRIEVGQMVM